LRSSDRLPGTHLERLPELLSGTPTVNPPRYYGCMSQMTFGVPTISRVFFSFRFPSLRTLRPLSAPSLESWVYDRLHHTLSRIAYTDDFKLVETIELTLEGKSMGAEAGGWRSAKTGPTPTQGNSD
jgi:hypothetical protein